MPKRSLAEQLDQAVQALLDRPGSAPPPVAAELRDLAIIAAELRQLPRQQFKENLKADLQRRSKMATMTVPYIPKGFHTLTPYLVVKDAATKVIEFARQAFGAEEVFRFNTPTGSIMHAEFRVGDSMIEIGDSNQQYPPIPATIHLKVDDVDAVYARALAAGGVSLSPPTDQPYGERGCAVKDVGGNHWYIASPLGQTHFLPDQRTVTPYMHVEGAGRCIEFLKQAFGAEEVMRYQTPAGVIEHAKVRIGDSVMEMGEAHGEYPAMPLNLHLYVPDADAVYQQALAAGATSVRELRDEPYGDRTGGVRDPFGNWYWVATHIKDVQS